MNIDLKVTVAKLFQALKHGDEEHQRWLREALDAYFDGRPVPPARDAKTVQPTLDEWIAELAGCDRMETIDGFETGNTVVPNQMTANERRIKELKAEVERANLSALDAANDAQIQIALKEQAEARATKLWERLVETQNVLQKARDVLVLCEAPSLAVAGRKSRLLLRTEQVLSKEKII